MTKSRTNMHTKVEPGHGPDGRPGQDDVNPAQAAIAAADAGERELLAMYRTLPPSLRPKLLAVVRTICDGKS